MPSSARQVAPQQDAAADAAEQELRELSYAVSHDLGASFRHLAGFSRLLVNELGHGLTDRQNELAERIRAASDKCQLMLEQLLAYSRLQHITLSPVRQDATPLMQLAMLQLALEVRVADAELVVEPLGEVDGDSALLATAFRHLLDNAIKFRRPGVAPHITVAAASDETHWRMRITDNGIGIEPAYRGRAFRMFQRLNGEEAYAGVGAGLAICRRIARRHGGEVWFLDCDAGACIELALPRAWMDDEAQRFTAKEGI
jgi:light-regulated signal transduction histidine kinase (bacteriophytochrome)